MCSASPLPPLAPEDHECNACQLRYAEVDAETALQITAAVPQQVGTATHGLGERELRTRPEPDTWSVMEYACHLRDVFATFTIRLHRARTEEVPALEPMLNDLRARRFAYNDRSLDAVLDELAANALGFAAEAGRVTDWTRKVRRLPGEERTTLWLVRQAAHEGIHHLRDIESVRRLVGPQPRLEFREVSMGEGDGEALATAMTTEMSQWYDGLDLDAHDMPRARPADLGPPGGTFLVGYREGQPVACGGVKRLPDGSCEIKRMYVVPKSRGQGVSRLLLHALEDAARRLGYSVVRLDTGPLNHAARHLYESEGYRGVANFNANPVATYFGEKRL